MADRCKRCNREKVDGKCPACGSEQKYTNAELIKKSKEYEAKCIDESSLPSIARLSVYLGVGRDYIYDHSTQGSPNYNKEFADIVESVMTWQEIGLTEKGLTGTFNASMAKLMLTKHGYSEKKEVDVSYKQKLDELQQGIQDLYIDE